MILKNRSNVFKRKLRLRRKLRVKFNKKLKNVKIKLTLLKPKLKSQMMI